MTTKAVSGTPARPYTPEDVIQQSLVSFGQGTNYMRVNRDAAQYVVDLMRSSIERFRVQDTWETDAVQILERLRSIGRLAALYATQGGQTVIDGENVSRASLMVQRISKSGSCPDGPGGGAVTTSFPTSLD